MGTIWLPDAFGPDQVRVTVGVEPSVEQLVCERDQFASFSQLFTSQRVLDRFPRLAQSMIFSGSWAVVVEADSGERVRLTEPSHDDAVRVAEEVVAAVQANGVAALATWRKG